MLATDTAFAEVKRTNCISKRGQLDYQEILNQRSNKRKDFKGFFSGKQHCWIEAMQEELLQFKLEKVWILVDLPSGKKAIDTKWEEGIDYDDIFAPVARIEAIRIDDLCVQSLKMYAQKDFNETMDELTSF
ncbi:hypothetical protein Tco_0340142 [Tanacetum coccineum]